MKHPAVVVDEERPSPDHPRRVPLPAVGPLWFTAAGMTTLPGEARGSLRAAPGGAVLHTSRDEVIAAGDGFHVQRHPYRLDDGDDLLVDTRRFAGFVVFNCFHAGGRRGGHDVRWRGFRVDDPARALVDVWQFAGRATAEPGTAGVPLEAVLAVTDAQQARMEPAVAAALTWPLVCAAKEGARLGLDEVTVTWRGRAAAATRSVRRKPGPGDEGWQVAAGAFFALCGEPAPGKAESARRIDATMPACDEAVAAVVRALFPEAWDVERAVREQAAMLDVESLA